MFLISAVLREGPNLNVCEQVRQKESIKKKHHEAFIIHHNPDRTHSTSACVCMCAHRWGFEVVKKWKLHTKHSIMGALYMSEPWCSSLNQTRDIFWFHSPHHFLSSLYYGLIKVTNLMHKGVATFTVFTEFLLSKYPHFRNNLFNCLRR